MVLCDRKVARGPGTFVPTLRSNTKTDQDETNERMYERMNE